MASWSVVLSLHLRFPFLLVSQPDQSRIIDVMAEFDCGTSSSPTKDKGKFVDPSTVNKSWMRISTKLAAEGMSPTKIAQMCEVTEDELTDLMREKWWQDEVVRILQAVQPAQATEILLRMSGPLAVMTLVSVMQNGKNDHVKLNAAKAILDKVIPKTLSMTIESSSMDIEEEARRLQEKINSFPRT